MVARLQRAILLGVLFVSLLGGTLLARFGTTRFGIVVGLLVLTGYAWILAAEFFCHWFVENPASRPTIAALLHAWCGETVLTPLVFCWRQPFRSTAISDCLPEVPDGRRGVLLVHGLMCNRGFWMPWMRRLERQGHPFLAIDLEPVFGSIESYSEAIEGAVVRLQSATGLPPLIVAHSMGGLAVRNWLSRYGNATRFHHVVTIGTPHQGTWLARFSNAPNGRQMAVDSAWLHDLASREAGKSRESFTCFYGHCDNVVFPSALGQLDGADNRRIDRTAHVALAFREEVIAEAFRWLQPDGAPVAPGTPSLC